MNNPTDEQLRREVKFYRDTLEGICADTRNTRAKRLASSALTFWDSMKKVKAARIEKGQGPTR